MASARVGRCVNESGSRRARLTFHGAARRFSVLVNQNIVDVAMFVDGIGAEGQGTLFVGLWKQPA